MNEINLRFLAINKVSVDGLDVNFFGDGGGGFFGLAPQD